MLVFGLNMEFKSISICIIKILYCKKRYDI